MTNFFSDRDQRGRPAEYLTVEYFRSRGVPAYINDAPEEDLEGRASHDVVVADEPWDIKTDYIALTTKRIFVELASLEHTRSSRFAYFIPTPYGYDIRIFRVQDLVDLYNEKSEVSRGDGTFFHVYKYPHGQAGDQKTNTGVFIPLEVAKDKSLAPWQVVKELL